MENTEKTFEEAVRECQEAAFAMASKLTPEDAKQLKAIVDRLIKSGTPYFKGQKEARPESGQAVKDPYWSSVSHESIKRFSCCCQEDQHTSGRGR
ncbi:MAG: hypothetical protein HQL74_13755 [Magnetococcales bacterium]|nr:hypothetical protein [Magnetococcales bacterium]